MPGEAEMSLSKTTHAKRSLNDMNYKLYLFPTISHDNNTTTTRKNDPDKEKEFCPMRFNEQHKHTASLIAKEQVNKDEKEKKQEIEKAYRQGLEEGEKAGHESHKKIYESALKNFRQAIIQFDSLKKEVYQNAERETVELALAIAKKIIFNEVTIQKDLILRVVKEAIQKVADHDNIKIRINPSDSSLLKNAGPQLSNLGGAIENITFVDDETISSGGCFIETNFGNIDARIEKQLQTIEEVFRFEFQQSEINY